MVFLKKLIDLILYSNVYIGLCAVAMTWQTYALLGESINFQPIIILVFCCTLVIYALHRLVGLSKVHDFLEEERYKVISSYKSHIWIYAIIGIVGAGISFFMVSKAVQLALVIPGIISLSYVLPVLGGKKNRRLRDVNFIKIFLVAIVWGFVTVMLPALELGVMQNTTTQLMLLERMIFIFAITLPFDLRDLVVDKHNKVDTLPAKLGIQNTILLALGLMLLFCFICYLNYGTPVLWGLLLSAGLTSGLIYLSKDQKHDYFFTGVIDGTMIVQFLLVWVFLLE